MSDIPTQVKTNESKPTKPGRPSELVMDVYSAGVIPFNWMRNMPQNWYPYFLTDILMMSPAVAGTISLISRLMALFMQPIAGGIIDRSSPKKGGKYRFWTYATVPLGSLLTVLLFLNYTKMGLGMGTTSLITTVLYALSCLVLSFGLAIHVGLYAVLTPDKESRVKLTTRRALGQSASQITLGMLAMPLVAYFGKGDEGKGFLLTVIFFAVLCILGYMAIAAVVKPWDPKGSDLEESKSGSPPPTFGEMMAHLFTNRPLAAIMLSDALRWGSRMMLTGFAIYNLKHVFGSTMLMATFMTTMNIVSFIFTILSEPFTMKFTKDRTYLWGNVILLVSMLAALLFGRNSVMLYIVIIAIGHIGYGPSAAQPPAYYAECAEWAERKTGKSAKTLVMSTSYLAMQIGVVLSGMLQGYCLAMIGYDAAKPVTPEIVNGIFQVASLVPALLLALSILAFLYYSKNQKHWFGEERIS